MSSDVIVSGGGGFSFTPLPRVIYEAICLILALSISDYD